MPQLEVRGLGPRQLRVGGGQWAAGGVRGLGGATGQRGGLREFGTGYAVAEYRAVRPVDGPLPHLQHLVRARRPPRGLHVFGDHARAEAVEGGGHTLTPDRAQRRGAVRK